VIVVVVVWATTIATSNPRESYYHRQMAIHASKKQVRSTYILFSS
jgi:hypothetical protein